MRLERGACLQEDLLLKGLLGGSGGILLELKELRLCEVHVSLQATVQGRGLVQLLLQGRDLILRGFSL